MGNNSFAHFTKIETINAVEVKSGKVSDGRVYEGEMSKKFPYSIETVLDSVINFTEKCNNSYKKKRKYTSDKVDCKYHNENLIETFIIKEIKNKIHGPDVIDSFIMGRLVYNRGTFGHYEIITINKTHNSHKQQVITVNGKMLTDDEVKKYTEPKFTKNSAFDKTEWKFNLIQLSEKETLLTYTYSAWTNHWILGKEISVPQVFETMSRNINDLIRSVEQGTSQKPLLPSSDPKK